MWINYLLLLEPNFFSDHYPIFFSCNFDLIDAKFKSGFSRSSFNAQAFNFYLSDLFKFLSFNDIKTLDYPEHWYFYLHESFSQSVKMKRAKRRNAPIFFSSHTMHLLNQKETNLRKLTKNWTLLLSLKQRELDKSLNESIELDKQIFIEKFNLSCYSHCFRLLRTLGFSKSLPSVMSYSGVSLSSSSEIANGFNTFFGSVFSPKIKYDVPASYEFLPELCIDNVTFSETEIRTLLLRCDDSSSMGADNIPSFVLRECATIFISSSSTTFTGLPKIAPGLRYGRYRMLRPYIKRDH